MRDTRIFVRVDIFQPLGNLIHAKAFARLVLKCMLEGIAVCMVNRPNYS